MLTFVFRSKHGVGTQNTVIEEMGCRCSIEYRCSGGRCRVGILNPRFTYVSLSHRTPKLASTAMCTFAPAASIGLIAWSRFRRTRNNVYLLEVFLQGGADIASYITLLLSNITLRVAVPSRVSRANSGLPVGVLSTRCYG